MHSSFTVTMFPDRFAKRKRECPLTLDELCDFVLSKKKRTKHRLPLIKLASFGETRNENDCLRYDANVTMVSGVELDYDREKIPFDDFSAKLRATGLHAALYTSPSCTPTRPRIRIILPLKNPLPREHLYRRAAFASRIDGLFGGNVFGSESWTLSQTYYVGRDLSNAEADFRAIVIEGDYIDKRDDLRRFEAISIAARQKIKKVKPTTVKTAKALDVVPGTAMRRSDAGKRDDRTPFQRHAEELLYGDADAALASMDYKERHDGKGVHHTQRDASYQLIARGIPDEDVIERVMAATFALPEAGKWNRKEEETKIRKLVAGAHRRLKREQQELLVTPPEPKPVSDGTLSFEEYRARQRTRIVKIFGLE
jgi:hypothetical protein